MSVLILSNLAEDGHVVPVARELFKRGVETWLFNPGDFPTSATISTRSAPSGQRTELCWSGETLDLSSIRSVWYRRPDRVELSQSLLPHEDSWIRGECAHFLDAVWANTDALWVSAPHILRRANLKLIQLHIAHELGFRIPPYLVTNDPNQARDFIRAHPEGTIVKTLGIPTLHVPDHGAAMVYTHKVVEADLDFLESVKHGPTFFQAFVQKRRDVRVTVIGDEVFAIGIESAHVPDAVVDFRLARIMDLPHVRLTLPESVEEMCRQLVCRLGLQFGAIDLLESPDGNYTFLEINPNGQWYWIQLMTGLPMASAMADLLERGLHGEASKPRERSAREPQVLPVGDQVVPIGRSLLSTLTSGPNGELPKLAASCSWIERQRGELLLHVGDVEVDQS